MDSSGRSVPTSAAREGRGRGRQRQAEAGRQATAAAAAAAAAAAGKRGIDLQHVGSAIDQTDDGSRSKKVRTAGRSGWI
jgi:hypothetical protein